MSLAAAALVAAVITPAAMAPPTAAAGDVGYEDMSYSGASSPTGREPQSKLWYNDGLWWGSLFSSSSRDFDIYRLNWATQTWSDTGVVVDERTKSSADALWDGNKLYVVSAISDQSSSSSPPTSGDTSIRVMRYSYSSAAKTYSLDAGYPVTIANAAVESVSLDKDTTGTIWVTWTYANGAGYRSVYVTHSTTNTATYVTPYVIPLTGTSNLNNSDYSAIVAYNGNIGVMWSNQNDATMYFAYHVDGAADTAWTLDRPLSGPGWADNHMTIKSLQADPSGQVFATTKTSLNNDQCPPSSTNSAKPLIVLLAMDGAGSWQRRTVSTAADCESRPIVMLAPGQRQVFVFATYPYPGSSYGSGGSIYYKATNLDNPNFDTAGPGTPFIQLAADLKINNATGTKQSLTAQSGLVVMAGDDHTHTYVHNAISLGSDTTAPTVTDTSPIDGATNVATSATVSATFSEPMKASTITDSSVMLTDTTASSAVAASVSYDSNSQTATLTPSSLLTAGHSFSATVSTAVTDLAGNPLAAAETWTFSTAAGGDGTPPSVTLTTPTDGTTVGGTSVTLSADASDNVAVDHVDFLIDSTVVGTDTSAPYSISWDSTSVADGSHTVTARAADPSGNSATNSHAVTVSNAPPPTGALFSDDFESGNLNAWTIVNTGGDGTAEVQSGIKASGTYAARFIESSAGASYAYARADMGSDQTELDVSGDFLVSAQGSSRQNIPLFRLFDSSGKRRLSLYRQNGTAGALMVWDGSGYHSTGKVITLNTWAHLELHVVAGSTSGTATVEVWLDDTYIYHATDATLPPVSAVQIGNETHKQPMDLFVDNVLVEGPGGATAPDTSITNGPSGVVNSPDANISFTSTISGSTFACSLDGAPFTSCTSPASYTGLGEGAHAFAVAATAGGVTDPTPATAGWTIDTTAPTVTDTSPIDGATNVATSATVSATFSEPMKASTITDSSVMLTDTTASSAVAASVSYDSNSQTATLTPSSLLTAGHSFSATVSTAVTDLAGNPLAAAETWTFSTAASPAPDTSITNGPSGVVNSPDANISFTSTISGSTFACSLDGAPFTSCTSPASYTGLGEGAHAFAVAATAGGVTDPTPATAGWTIDTTAPTVTDTSPIDGATNVATSATVSATFSEPMKASTITDSSVMLTDTTASSAVAASVSYDSNSQTATLTPSSLLTAGHSFSATVSTAVTDLAGNPLAAAETWTFSTVEPPPPPPTGALFSDDFESGNLNAWTSVNTGGDGAASVQSSVTKSGSYAAYLTESSNSGSYANLRADLGSDQTELTISGDFRVVGEGASNQNIPLYRLFDSSGKRRLSLYRQDQSGGIYVWDASGYHSTGVSMSLNTWAHLDLHVIATSTNGSATVEVSLDGTSVYQVTNATLPLVRTVQVGNETSRQPMALYVDNVTVAAP